MRLQRGRGDGGGLQLPDQDLALDLVFGLRERRQEDVHGGGKMSNGIDYIASTEGMTYPYTGKSKRLNDRGG